jgi:hypothetical protein
MATRYRSIGPILEINYNIEPRVSFKSVGWYEFIELESGEPRELANFNLKLYYRF